ncbi:hypothetical protein NEMIN01_0967 [Nematocida minor]|uniref:uncharacterized protein n=1 Tax=Nematocida minor TaxID=1912983 RepID=UPI00221E940F|nr:uncharacterized protein NEMIN01_0967 [Nematocida minor]KAI5190268.1 hypothetical protein NEMIN01_0967 [Nematocida minor]
MYKTLYDKTVQQLEKYKTYVETIREKRRGAECVAPEEENSSAKQTEKDRGSSAPVASDSSTEHEDIFCRICYSYESPLGCLKDLVSPCGCKGTIKYVHRYCLRIWRFKGKQVKDIKVCEQCFCEYVVDDEKSVGKSIVTISTIAIILSMLILTSIFVSSSADTAEFIANDIYAYMYGNSKMISFDDPIIICNMDAVVAEKNHQNPARASHYTVQKMQTLSGENEHFASIKKRYIYTLKNIHLLDVKKGDSFTSIAALGCAYTIMFEDTPFLFVNFLLSFWRVISFDKIVDWCLYAVVIGYIYSKIFEKIYRYIDNYCMYVINLY